LGHAVDVHCIPHNYYLRLADQEGLLVFGFIFDSIYGFLSIFLGGVNQENVGVVFDGVLEVFLVVEHALVDKDGIAFQVGLLCSELAFVHVVIPPLCDEFDDLLLEPAAGVVAGGQLLAEHLDLVVRR